MNFDDYEQLPTTSVFTNMTAGAIAGVLEHCVMYPLDSVKTRMQSLSPPIKGHTIMSTLSHMIKQEGLLRPIRGMGAVVAGAGPAHAFYFATYEYTKEALSKFATHNQINYIVSATMATLIHDAISNPTEVIKQRLQMYESPYRSVIHCTKTVYQTEGLRAFYRSYSTQLVMNLPYQTIHFSTYEFFQSLLNKDRKYNPPVHVLAGGAAGAVAAALTTPLDVVKTLLNTQETGIGNTQGMLQAIAKIYERAGPLGFFKGLCPRILYSMPATAICWSTYEFFKFILSSNGQMVLPSFGKFKSDPTISPPPPSATATTTPSTATTIKHIDDSKMGTGLRYVLPSTRNVSNTDVEISSPIRETSLKPRELPAMSGAGMYGALNMNTLHSESSPTSRQY